MTPTIDPALKAAQSALLVTLICGLLTAGCTKQQGILPNYVEDDLRERHLIKQQARPQKLTVMPVGSNHDQISPSDLPKITRFVEGFQLNGSGYLAIEFAGSKASEPAIMAIMTEMNEKRTTTKTGDTKSGSVAVILSYTSIQSVLDRNCEGTRTEGGQTYMVPNKTMGCSYALAFAQQVENPRDLIEPQPREKVYYTPKAGYSNTTTTTDKSKSTDPVTNLAEGLKSLLNGN